MTEALRSVLLYAASLIILVIVGGLALQGLPLLAAVPLVLLVALALFAIVGIEKGSAKIAGRVQSQFVERVQRQAEGARRSVLYDGDVGLYQRWYLELRLTEESARCVRYGLQMALVVVRLGSHSLHEVAKDSWQEDATQAAFLTARTIRTVDLSALLGPREFAVCLVHCDRAGAEVAVARLERALQAYQPSVGLVLFPEEKVEAKLLIELARSRAYAASHEAAA